jgi:hypothetical protein
MNKSEDSEDSEEDCVTIKSNEVINYNFSHDLIELYLNLSRKNDPLIINTIYNNYCHSIQRVIDDKTIDEPDRKRRLVLLYKLIAQTRDIVYGKGERLLAYVLICAWYKFYPVSASFAIKTMVTNNDNDEDLYSPYGSWCDIKYFCDYVHHAEYIDDDSKNKLVDTAIGIMNHQINKDRISWNYTLKIYLEDKMNNPASFLQRPNGRDVMTFAVKWCPREKSKFGWLYELIVFQWNSMFSPNTQFVTKEQIVICKRNYRKMISALNRELDTTQIKQCANKWSTIKPENVSIGTMVSQKTAFGKTINQDRIDCNNNFNEYFEETNTICDYKLSTNRSMLPLSTIVQYAMNYIQNGIRDERKKTWINNIWNKNMNHLNKSVLTNSIPIIDISWDIDKDSRNTSIGLGIAVAIKSNINRIILFDTVSYWLSVSPNQEFISIIEQILNRTKTATLSNIDSAFSLIAEAFASTVTNDTDSIKDDMVFFIFNGGKTINTALKEQFRSSTFIFWNIQRTGYLNYKLIDSAPGNFYLCGNSISDINNIQKYYIDRFKNSDLGNYIENILNNPRYKSMERCLIDVM